MKIEVVSFTGNSGLADYSVSLARALAKYVDVLVVTSHSLPRRFDEMGFTVERVFRRSRHYPLDLLRFIAGVIRRRPNWILLQGALKIPLLDGLAVRFLRLFSIKTVITVHDVLPHYPRPWSATEYRFYYQSFNRVIVHSDSALNGVRALGIQGDVLVVPHGIYDIFDLTGISRSQARANIGGLTAEDFVVLFFGNLEPRKGFMEFIETAEALQDYKNLKFLIAGSSFLNGHGRSYVARLKAAKKLSNVIVHDHRIAFEDVENYFAASDVVVLPYLEGTTSGVLKLALAFAKPVIATNVGDFPEQIPIGAGVVIENDNTIVASLCNAIEQIRSNQSAYTDAMSAASHLAQWPEIADQIVSYLKKTDR
jgi:glycosyltransferase involved in cell wall biosynthesis